MKRGILVTSFIFLIFLLSFVSAYSFWDKYAGKVTEGVNTKTINFIKVPSDGSIVHGLVEINVFASIPSGVERLHIYIGSGSSATSYKTCFGVSECAYMLDTTKLENKEYFVYANVRDNSTLEWINTEEVHFIVNNSRNVTGNCNDSDNGIELFIKGTTVFGNGEIKTDGCIRENLEGSWDNTGDIVSESKFIVEYSCDINSPNSFKEDVFQCQYGCSDGACVSSASNTTIVASIAEQVKCVFKNSQAMQKCYTAEQNSRGYCSGIGACIADISGYQGENITWKSSCGGYDYTYVDGNNEYTDFNCVPNEGANETEIQKSGFKFAYWQCHDGSEMKFGNDYACNSGETLKNNAEEFCKGKCKDVGNITKCGVNSFSVFEECNNAVNIHSDEEGTNNENEGEQEKFLICKDACPLDGKCYPFGYRKSGEYCSDAGQFITQLESEKSCDNNFECETNVCVNGNCVSASLIQSIIAWFKKLFGAE